MLLGLLFQIELERQILLGTLLLYLHVLRSWKELYKQGDSCMPDDHLAVLDSRSQNVCRTPFY